MVQSNKCYIQQLAQIMKLYQSLNLDVKNVFINIVNA